MKVLHVTQYCHLGSTGGTERYVHDLIGTLGDLGVDNGVVWLRGGTGCVDTEHDGVQVFQLPTPSNRHSVR